MKLAAVLLLLVAPAAQAFTLRQPTKMAATATKPGAAAAGSEAKVEEPLLLRAARGEVSSRVGGWVGGWVIHTRTHGSRTATRAPRSI